MKPTKTLLLPVIAICWIIATITYCANAQAQALAAGPPTNIVTLSWSPPATSTVPYVYEVHQTTTLATNAVWTVIAANIPSNITFLQLQIDKDVKYWKVRSVNSTNSVWVSDFSNTASTLWPGQGGSLAVRLGP